LGDVFKCNGQWQSISNAFGGVIRDGVISGAIDLHFKHFSNFKKWYCIPAGASLALSGRLSVPDKFPVALGTCLARIFYFLHECVAQFYFHTWI